MKLFEAFGFKKEQFSIVQEQAEPDPDFPTVPFPNPEEGRSALTLPFQTADANNATVVLVNDPDADRFQLGEKLPSGEWRVFSGNEMGAIMTWWVWHCWRKDHANDDPSNLFILNSAVSSSIVRTMAAKEGFKCEQTLTGFKWLGNKADELRKEGRNVLLAWEESIGFMPGAALDKDGISAAAIFAEIASYLKSQNMSITKQLFAIYKEYGFHLIRSSYWFTPDPEITKKIFGKLRKEYPKAIGKYPVKYVRDLNVMYDNEQPGNKPVLPESTSSDMITFTLTNGSLATIRASGTEPKIKYYIELKTPPGKEEKDLADVTAELEELEKVVVEVLFEPKLNGLLPRK
ncbi:hypothetical protein AB6A40_002571 [Gnathostoma spinigerum]|uniref:Phosphoglucomutase n=1 Tax=Gnathostoma spinigerum TaxID=75299 RepID=A0ABD6EH29_9BILA